MERLLAWKPRDVENRKLLSHLRTEHELGALLRLLDEPGLRATNHLVAASAPLIPRSRGSLGSTHRCCPTNELAPHPAVRPLPPVSGKLSDPRRCLKPDV